MRPNMGRIVGSPGLGAQSFVIVRKPGRWSNGRFVLDAEQEIQAFGNIQPAGYREVEQLPEGDRVKGMMVFRTTTEILLSGEGRVSDELIWRSERYKVLQVNPWVDYGYYEAFAVRKEGV